jgi:hypothetical protein
MAAWLLSSLVVAATVTVSSGGPPPPAFNTTLAWYGHVLSQIAYCQKDEITNWNALPCDTAKGLGLSVTAPPTVIDGRVGGFKKVYDWGTRVYVAALSEERIVVSFRGSSNLTNWLADFDFQNMVPYETECPECKVHGGFYKSWLSVARETTAAVQALRVQHPKADILVTGHSLGAAMAVLCATSLYYNLGLPVTHVYTYGQPRVGNAAFHRFYNNGTTARQYASNGSSFRLVHWRDPVPRLPFQILGFEHTSTEVWYTEDSKDYVVCDGGGEDPLCSDSLPLDLRQASDHCDYMGHDICGCI